MRLYSYWRSSASWRVRTALHYKGLFFEYVPVDLTKDGGEQYQPAYEDLNPMKQVPTLEVTDQGRRIRLTQSLAIIEYLDDCWPEPGLLPREPAQRARVRALSEIVNSGIQPLQNTRPQRELRSRGVDPAEWCRVFIAEGLTALEREARRLSGTFLVGEQLSMADLCLVPQLYNARRFELPLDTYPTLLRVEEACQQLPAFQRSHPDAQPDAPSPA